MTDEKTENTKLPSLADIVLGIGIKQKKLLLERMAALLAGQNTVKFNAKVDYDKVIKAADEKIAKVNELNDKYDTFTADEINTYLYELEQGRNPTLRG